jgi:hypothetical protein
MIANIENCKLIIVELEKKDIKKLLNGKDLLQFCKKLNINNKTEYKIKIYCCDPDKYED